ncbi:MAG: VIT domain-containing protein, partial [Psychromonas sp.]
MKKNIIKILLSILLIALSVSSYAVSANINTAGLFYQDQDGQSKSALILESHVEMRVNGLINRVSVKQVFKNESDQWINASYLFPLP